LLGDEGIVRILDMGLARMTPSPGDALEGGAQADLTNTGSVMGTIDYMAPEQALDAKSLDYRADLYVLGCTLYFLVTENPPFRHDTVMRRLLAHREEPAPRISAYRPEVPSELDQIFATMMAKSPDDRFPSMKHLVVALDSLGLNDIEDEQMATMDMPDDRSDGFIGVSDEDVLGLSDTSATTAGSSNSNSNSNSTDGRTDGRRDSHGAASVVPR
jgi:serine/threonine protein kinase